MNPLHYFRTAVLAGLASIFLTVAESGADDYNKMKVDEMKLKAKVEDLRSKAAAQRQRANLMDKNDDPRALTASSVASDYEKKLKSEEKALKSVQKKLYAPKTVWGAMKAPAKRAARKVTDGYISGELNRAEENSIREMADKLARAQLNREAVERNKQEKARAQERRDEQFRVSREAAKEEAKRTAQNAARDATRNATLSAVKDAAADSAKNASKTASKSSSKSASQDAAKGAVSHPPPATGGMHCFVAGTLVHTPSGCREIKELKIGDEVLSFNERTRRIESAPVLRTWKSQRADLITLGTQEGGVTCSQNHRFYTADQEWRAANQLRAGHKIMKRDPAHPRRVLAAEACTLTAANPKSPVAVYNLTVANHSNYFVGPGALLCHNAK